MHFEYMQQTLKVDNICRTNNIGRIRVNTNVLYMTDVARKKNSFCTHSKSLFSDRGD